MSLAVQRTKCFVTILDCEAGDNYVVDCLVAPDARTAATLAREEVLRESGHDEVDVLACYEGYLKELPLSERAALNEVAHTLSPGRIAYQLAPGPID